MIKRNLALSGDLILRDELFCFCSKQGETFYKGNYPDEKDIGFYERMRQMYNNKLDSRLKANYGMKKDLKSQLLHEQIQHGLPKATTYKSVFHFITQMYEKQNHLNEH